MGGVVICILSAAAAIKGYSIGDVRQATFFLIGTIFAALITATVFTRSK